MSQHIMRILYFYSFLATTPSLIATRYTKPEKLTFQMYAILLYLQFILTNHSISLQNQVRHTNINQGFCTFQLLNHLHPKSTSSSFPLHQPSLSAKTHMRKFTDYLQNPLAYLSLSQLIKNIKQLVHFAYSNRLAG